jgi:hypothetical protein
MRWIHVSDGENQHGAGIVGSWLIVPALVLAFLVGCGFNDELTRRGFINAGDLICAETIIKAYVDSRQAAARGKPLSRAEVIRAEAQGFDAAARRLRTLKVTGDDMGMRDRMAKAFKATAERLDHAAASTGGDSAATRAAIRAIAEMGATTSAIRAYGFAKCAAPLRPT